MMLDRVDEYIFEKISDGDYVLKLHKSNRDLDHRLFSRALDLLPHLRAHISQMDAGAMVTRIIQGAAFTNLIFGSLSRFNGISNI